MPATIIDGNAIAEQIKRTLAEHAAELTKAGRPPCLIAVQVGEDPASKLYTDMQRKTCESVGIRYELREYPRDIGQGQMLAEIAKLNADRSVSGLILQMPLPDQLHTPEIQMAISPKKDVEGIHPENLGRLFAGSGHVAPCTPLAAIECLTHACKDLGGKELVIVGRSDIVGKPISVMLLHKSLGSPTVAVSHSRTRDLAFHTRRADVIIAATGYSQMNWLAYKRKSANGAAAPLPPLVQREGFRALAPLITGEMLGEGQIVIDVATNRVPKGLDDSNEPLKNDKGKTAMVTVGDVDAEAAMARGAAVTPVPGGVGPVTVAMLLRNTIECARRS
ncbi:MAG TPA: bifunctional methylenetetrahydrofolate dehydrogenase/methenyltetrahydrofolate cyclohydrolase [Phycisphaerales bacterium]|nr:bifunctional methylenetetrahydrofolate dehydrogenase/methenyltetrahydrofolate cyclohydrolase [Phycisphaerales bacterium]